MSAFLNDSEVTEINKHITTASDYDRTLYTHCAFSFLIHNYRHASGKSQLPNGAFKLFAIVFMTKRSNCCSAPAVPWNIDTVMSPTEQLTLSTASVRRHWSPRLRCIASLGFRLSHHPQLRGYTSRNRSMRPNTSSLAEPEELSHEQLGHNLQYTNKKKLSSDSINWFVIFNCGHWMENNRWNKALLWRKTKAGHRQYRREDNIKLDLK
jgi:hypothetical protein